MKPFGRVKEKDKMMGSKVKINAINSVRAELMGIATLLVLLNHSKGFAWNGHLGILRKLFSEGGMGVDIFLLLSGIGLYYSFAKNEGRKEFYKRRFLRIMPIYLPLAMIFLAILECLGKCNSLNYVLRVTTVSYWLSGDGIYWYVSYILVFYLLYPFIYKYLIKGGVNPVIPIAFMFSVEIVVLIFFNEYYVKTQLAFSRLPITILACYLGKYAYEEKEVKIINIGALLVPFVLLRGIRILFVSEVHEAMVTFLVKTANMFFVLFFVYLYYAIRPMVFSFIKNILQFFGGCSLEIYLIHISLMTIAFIKLENVSVLFYFCVIVPAALVMSYFYHRLVEIFLKRGHNLCI